MADHMTEEEIVKIQWMFQYNPVEVYDLEDVIKTRLIEHWYMYWHRDLARAGQRIYFMRSGADKAAITFVGRIASPVYENEEVTDKYHHYLVDVTYDEQIDPIIKREEMRNDFDEALRTYKPYVQGLFHTNFLLPPNVARRTAELVKNRTRPIGASAGAYNRRVFISHSHEDGAFVEKLAEQLQHALGGPDLVWYDRAPTGLKGGQGWWEEIVKQIETRPVFVLILSPDSMRSGWVKDEIGTAWPMRHSAKRLRFIPVLYKQCDIPAYLQQIQYVSFEESRPYNTALNELIDIIKMTGSEDQ